MAKLHQILAILKGVKARTDSEITKQYQQIQKSALTAGLSRNYSPLNEDGQKLPSENSPVRLRVYDALEDVSSNMVQQFNLVYEVEAANQKANADLVVDGQVLLPQVPVTYLLYLEKKITDWRTIVSKLPVLDSARKWTWDESAGLHRSEPVSTIKTTKVPEVVVKYPATDKHPAQTEMFTKDVPQGTWVTEELSGAVTVGAAKAMLARADAVLSAIKMAREAANQVETVKVDVGTEVLGYLKG